MIKSNQLARLHLMSGRVLYHIENLVLRAKIPYYEYFVRSSYGLEASGS